MSGSNAKLDARTVTVAGRRVDLSPEAAVDRELGYECLSAGWIDAEWRGCPVEPLLARAGVAGATTHLAVEASDGLRACVPVETALSGLLAVERDGRALSGPRFVAPGVDGPRAVKDVERIEPLELAPHEDPGDYEELGPASES